MQCSAWGTKAQKKLTWRKDAGTLGSQGHWGAGESCCWPTWTLPGLQGRPPAGLASSLQLVTPHSLFCVRLCADGLQQCHLGGWAFLVALRWLRDRLQCWRPGFDPWVRKIPWWREWLPTAVFLPGKSHGQRSLWITVHGVVKGWTWLSPGRMVSAAEFSVAVVVPPTL